MIRHEVTTRKDLAARVVEKMGTVIRLKLNLQKTVHVALSGGTIPSEMWRLMTAQDLDYKQIHWCWVDERMLPHEDEESNFGVAKRDWFDKIEGDLHVYPMPVGSDMQLNAREYETQLDMVPKNRAGLPQFDLILLGMGDDGHTASLFPENMERDLANEEWVVAVDNSPKPPSQRLSLNYSLLTSAKNLWFVVSGEQKAELVSAILQDSDRSTPAGYVAGTAKGCTWLIDEGAVSKL